MESIIGPLVIALNAIALGAGLVLFISGSLFFFMSGFQTLESSSTNFRKAMWFGLGLSDKGKKNRLRGIKYLVSFFLLFGVTMLIGTLLGYGHLYV